MEDLFERAGVGLASNPNTEIAPGAVLLRGFALPQEADLTHALTSVIALAPLRHMQTPGGHTMSVAMTNCGELGWLTDRQGYRYAGSDPLTGQPWPPMPDIFREFAARAALEAGYASFTPDACLINRYNAGAKMSLHQDKDEKALGEPVVSVSLGLPAIFYLAGPERSDKPARIKLTHGDVVVWGGPSRLNFHGIMPLKEGEHPLLGPYRFNITFRRFN